MTLTASPTAPLRTWWGMAALSGILLVVQALPAIAQSQQPSACETETETSGADLVDNLAALYPFAGTVAQGKAAINKMVSYQCIAAEYLRRVDSCTPTEHVALMRQDISLNRVREIANPQGATLLQDMTGEARVTELKKRLMAKLASVEPECSKVTVAAGDRQRQDQAPGADDAGQTTDENAQTAELPANCRAEAGIRNSSDSDVTRLADEIIAARLCYTVETVVEGGRSWIFQLFESTAKPDGPAWYLPHDNENSAFDTALRMVMKHGGKVLAVETGDNRLLGEADPNRFFGTDPAHTGSCKSLGGEITPKYTGKVMAVFEGSPYPILTLHNNTNGGGVRLDVNTSKEQGHPPQGSAISADIDDFIYYSAPKPYAQNEAGRSVVAALNKLGIGVVYEYVNLANNDCSLSNHAALIGKEYFNIEAQHGHTETQTRIADRLVEYLQTR